MSYVQDGPVGRMVAHRGVYLSSSHEACGDQVKHPADGTESEALQNRFAHSGYLCHECVCARANRVGPAGMDQRPIRTATAGVWQHCTLAKRDDPRGRLDRCGHSERDPVRKREIAPSRRFPAVVCVTLGKRRPHDRHFIRREAAAKASKHDLRGPDVVLVRLNCAYLAAINTWRLCVENRPRVLGFCFVLVGSATTKPGF